MCAAASSKRDVTSSLVGWRPRTSCSFDQTSSHDRTMTDLGSGIPLHAGGPWSPPASHVPPSSQLLALSPAVAVMPLGHAFALALFRAAVRLHAVARNAATSPPPAVAGPRIRGAGRGCARANCPLPAACLGGRRRPVPGFVPGRRMRLAPPCPRRRHARSRVATTSPATSSAPDARANSSVADIAPTSPLQSAMPEGVRSPPPPP